MVAALSLFTIHFSLLTSSAQIVQYLVLTQAGGEVGRFALADTPVITFADGNLVVTCGEATLTVNMEGLKSSFEDVSTAITAPSFAHSTFEGLKAGDTVTIYTLDGKKIGTAQADGEGRAGVDLSPYGRGIYILRTPRMSIKIKN